MMKKMHLNSIKLASFAALMLAADSALAAVPSPLPEPGILELLAIGTVIFVAIKLKDRNRK